MQTRLIIIRHGRTGWNAQRRYMGSTDIDLDDVGRAQAERLKGRLESSRVDRIYSSDSMRASNFAAIVFGRRDIEKMRELREMDFGIIEGMTHEEILKKHPLEYDRWLKDVHRAKMPGAESMDGLRFRVLGAYRRIVSDNIGRTVGIVTHAGPIRVILDGLAPSGDMWRIMPEHASLNIIDIDERGANISTLNDTSHLK